MEKVKNFPRIFVFVIILLVASTLAAWYVTKSVADRETAKLFNDEATVVESWITNRLEFYKTIVYSLQGFWAGGEVVTEKEWQTYVATLKIKERFPGVTSLTFIRRENNNYFITFIYPPERKAALETNLAAEERRLRAINRAVDNNSVTVTDKISLVADQSPGFVMFAPLYKTGFPIDTIEARRIAVEGLASVAFRSEQVFKDLFDAHDTFPYLDFELFKGQVLEEDHILYDHDYSHHISKIERKGRLETKRTINSDGETFTLLVSSKPTFGLKPLEEKLPNLVLIIGLAFDFLIFLFVLRECLELQKSNFPKSRQSR